VTNKTPESDVDLPEKVESDIVDAAPDDIQADVADQSPDKGDDVEKVTEDVTDIKEAAGIDTYDEVAEPAPLADAQQKGSVMPALLGGVVAASIGFGASAYMQPKSWPFGGADTGVADQLDAQSDALTALQDKLNAMEVVDVEQTTTAESLQATLQQTQSSLDVLDQSMKEIQDRLAALESLPAASGDGQTNTSLLAFESEMQSLRALVEEQKSALQAAANTAAQTEQSALEATRLEAARAAVGRIQIAGDSGLPFADALQDFQASSDVEVPVVLADVAANGVPPLSDLQTGFADAARAALSAARSNSAGEETGANKLVAFLKAQTGARSVTPREGSDPDAVLSRAEAAALSGSLTDALAELETLPDAARDVMSDWTGLASTRLEALNAIDALSAALVSN